MNSKLLHPEVQDFIIEKSDQHTDLTKLILAGSPFKDITTQELAEQISGRQKALQKLPSWTVHRNILYPPTLNLEQTSSDQTAAYKSALVSGDTLIDVTGGWGVDAFAFNQHINKVTHCELNPTLSALAAHNYNTRQASTIQTVCQDGLTVVRDAKKFDWIYIDPSRRSTTKGKVFFLNDCLPDVTLHQELFLDKAANVMIKTSPLLDIQHGLAVLKNVVAIHVVAVNNEVKELLWILQKDYTKEVTIVTANLKKQQKDIFSFTYGRHSLQETTYHTPLTYLYEPNSAILKSGGFADVAQAYGVKKLHPNSHLYTSDSLLSFPGRVFKIITRSSFSKKDIKRLHIEKANITTRNFPDTVASIRKRFKIKDGGDTYLFFTTDLHDTKIILHCKKIATSS
ncbi:class I SAM-dependent methyltransferase [Aquimarina sp. W85]|uniref:THUMP-like domain-containing protein n=1 Tax=Aquimarina rhodophyticola TaxID=3342246 RepID=UPI00366C8422